MKSVSKGTIAIIIVVIVIIGIGAYFVTDLLPTLKGKGTLKGIIGL